MTGNGLSNQLPEGEIHDAELFEEDVSCKKCFYITSDSKKNGLRERAKQTKLARKKGKKYPYLEVSADEYFESGF